MKKILGLILIAGSLVACNNASETTTSDDTTTTTTTPTTTTPIMNDTLGTGAGMDTMNRVGDTTNRTQQP